MEKEVCTMNKRYNLNIYNIYSKYIYIPKNQQLFLKTINKYLDWFEPSQSID